MDEASGVEIAEAGEKEGRSGRDGVSGKRPKECGWKKARAFLQRILARSRALRLNRDEGDAGVASSCSFFQATHAKEEQLREEMKTADAKPLIYFLFVLECSSDRKQRSAEILPLLGIGPHTLTAACDGADHDGKKNEIGEAPQQRR